MLMLIGHTRAESSGRRHRHNGSTAAFSASRLGILLRVRASAPLEGRLSGAIILMIIHDAAAVVCRIGTGA